MPAGIVFAIAGHADATDPSPKRLQAVQRARHFIFFPDDADEVLHHFLQIMLYLVRAFGLGTAREWFQSFARDFFKLILVNGASLVFLRKFCGKLHGPLSEHDNVRERVATEPI